MKKILISTFLGLLIAWFALPSIPAIGQVREVKERLDLDRTGRVSIENHKGSIQVSTWNRSEVDIRAEIEAGGNSRRERGWVEETEIRIDANGRSVRIKTDYRNFQNRSFWGGSGGSSPYVHYIIRIPESAELEISDHKSEIRSENFNSLLWKSTIFFVMIKALVATAASKTKLSFSSGKFGRHM